MSLSATYSFCSVCVIGRKVAGYGRAEGEKIDIVAVCGGYVQSSVSTYTDITAKGLTC